VIYEPLKQIFPDLFGEITLEEYHWALQMVWSRTVGLFVEEEYCRVMIPLLDLANHKGSAASSLDEVVSFNQDTMEISLSSPKILTQSSSIYAFYGPYNNSKLCYSFIISLIFNCLFCSTSII